MLETARQRTDLETKAPHFSARSFLQEYSQKREASIALQSREELKDKDISDFMGGGIHDMLTPEYGDWLQMRMEEGVEYLAHRTDPDRFINLFDQAKWKLIDDNQGFQDAGEDTWFAKRNANINGEIVPVTVALLGTNPDSALSMRIVVRGLESFLHIDKYNGIWETLHSEVYEFPKDGPEDERPRHERQIHRHVHVKANQADHQFYSKIIDSLQTNPQPTNK